MDYDFRFIIIGDRYVGKTCFYKRFFELGFDEKHLSTINFDMKIKDVEVEKDVYKICLIDNFIFYLRYNLYERSAKKADGIFLLFDVTNENSFDYIFPLITFLKEVDSKFLLYLIGNKIDKPDRVILKETAETLAESLGIQYFEVSCKNNINIQEAITRMTLERSKGFYNRINSGSIIKKNILLSPITISTEINSKVNELYSKTLVKQKLINNSENPIELKIHVYKKESLIFSSFSAQIGDSIKVKSKVILKEKAKEKYTDSISSGNAPILISDEPTNKNIIIINMGNIPPKQEFVFISEFIQFTECSDNYIFELFRNLPIFKGENLFYSFSNIKGQVEIKSKKIKINKKILSKQLKIIEEKYLDKEKKNNYLLKYEYINLRDLLQSNLNNNSYRDIDFIPSSKIYFDIEINEPIIYFQKSTIKQKEENYIIQYKNFQKKYLIPALFIFLIDQSCSMKGNPIKAASKALLLFLQSLPAGSYYQIIGFGADFYKNDIEPKEYNKKNIINSIKSIERLDAVDSSEKTNIYSPLLDIFNSYKNYDKIKLHRNIFLFTNGEIKSKEETLAIMRKNSNEYSIFWIRIMGEFFDKTLIKKVDIGKGNYNFPQNIEGLNEIIATELYNVTSSSIYNFNLKSSFDNKKYIYKTNSENSGDIIMGKNKITNFSYIIGNKEEENNINENKINVEIKYIENDRNKDEEKIEKYEIIPKEIPAGEELSKLIINNYILNNSNLNIDEKIKLALKYQIFNEYTSLFAEVELSNSINKEIKILEYKENNQIKMLLPFKFELDHFDREYKFHYKGSLNKYNCPKKKGITFPSISMPSFDFFNKIVSPIKWLFSYGNKEDKNEDLNEKKKRLIEKEKENIMKMIRTQDFIGGSWDINKQTKIIKEKYEKEFKLLKNLKDKNIDDKIGITILIIYFIEKEHSELLKELIMIIKKGKLFIQENTKDSYENIIEEIGL